MKRNFLIDDNNGNLLLEIFVTAPNNPVSKKKYDSSLMSIEVRSKEGYNVPHIHFKKSNGIQGCIKINESGYFIHPGYEGTLNNNEAKILNLWMRCKYPNDYKIPTRTNWEFIRDFWNEAEKEHPVLIEKQPDYSTINNTGIRR